MIKTNIKKIDNIHGFLLFTVLAIVIVFLRKPETLLHAQLWAEDGNIWLAQAYNVGVFKSLLISDGGYFQTFSRIIASLSLFLPLNKVPLFFNVVEFLLQISVALFFLTDRFKSLIPKVEIRVLLALLYLILPNTAEMDGHLTSSQWYLAVLAFLILIAAPAVKSKLWKAFDYLVLALSGLTGTFAIFLTPIAFFIWLKKCGSQNLLNLIIIFSCGILQGVSVFFLSHVNRVHILPQLTIKNVFAIFSRQVVFGLLSGARGYTLLLNNISWTLILVTVISVLAIGLIIYSLIKSPLELKLFLLLGLGIFFASLITPTKGALSYDILKVLSRSTDGIRYWFIPMLSFAACLVWGLSKTNPKGIRLVCAILLCFSIFGVAMDFRHHAYPDENFNFYAQKFSNSAKGQHLVIPITPPGWEMDLVKR